MLLLIAQSISEATIAALAAAAMPIIAVGLGVIMGDRRLRKRFVLSILFAILGGIFANGFVLQNISFSKGFALGLFAPGFFAWRSRTTVHAKLNASFKRNY